MLLQCEHDSTAGDERSPRVPNAARGIGRRRASEIRRSVEVVGEMRDYLFEGVLLVLIG